MAEGHWDSQKASRKETRTTRASAEVQRDREATGDRPERQEETEEVQDIEISRREKEVHGDREATGDRRKRSPRREGTESSGAQKGVRKENSGGGSMLTMGVGGDRAQGTRQRAEVGCHWSGSKSSGDTESGSGEPESGNRLEVSEVQSDTETEGRRGDDGNAEVEAKTTQGGERWKQRGAEGRDRQR